MSNLSFRSILTRRLAVVSAIVLFAFSGLATVLPGQEIEEGTL